MLKPIADSAPAKAIINKANNCPKLSLKAIELIKIINVIDNNIISIETSIKITFFRFNMKPIKPIKNKIKAQVIFI